MSRNPTPGAIGDRAAQLAAHYAHCETRLRAQDRDRWLACLFAPAEARPALHAIHAFTIELAGVRAKVSQPLLGEMRLRWWLDAIETQGAEGGGGARAHPIADALIDAIGRHTLPRAEFEAFIAAAAFDLYDDPMETQAMLEDYCRDVFAVPLRWAARILGDDEGSPALAAAGYAYGAAKVLRDLPAQAAAGQCFVPADLLARHGASPADIRARAPLPGVRAALEELRASAASRYEEAKTAARALTSGCAALLPAATVPLHLAAFARNAAAPFSPRPEPPQWRRQWRLWRAARGVGL